MTDTATTPEAFDPISRCQSLAVRLIGAQDDPTNYAPCGGLVKQLGRHPSMSVSGLNAALMAAERMVGVIESDINQHGVEAVLDALDSAVRLAVLARDVYQATTTAEGSLTPEQAVLAQPSTPRIEAPSDGMPVWCCGDELPAMLENLAVKLREVPTITGHAHTAMAEILAHSICNYTRELYRLAGIPTESGQ